MDRRSFLKFGSVAAGAFSLAACAEAPVVKDLRAAGVAGSDIGIEGLGAKKNRPAEKVSPIDPVDPIDTPMGPQLVEPEFYTKANPGKWAGKEATHLPSLEVLPEIIVVKTPHPMAADHYICRHQLRSEEGVILADRIIKPTETPETQFAIQRPSGKVICAFSTCNLHGIWKEDFPMDAMAKGFVAEPIYTAAKPGKWKGKEATHLAVLKSSTVLPSGVAQIVIETPMHVMTAEHYISRHEVRNRQGECLAVNTFKVGTDMTAVSTIDLPQVSGAVCLFSHCNLHGIWETPVTFDQVANVFSAQRPGTGAPAAHIPTATLTDISTAGVPKSLLTVTNTHEMIAGTHYVYRHQIQTNTGVVLAENNIYIQPNVVTPATSYFTGNLFQQPADSYVALAYCNLHGIWKAPLTFEQTNIVYTTTPGAAGGAAATHVPTIQFDATNVTVTTPHAMTVQHYISKHQLRDATGKLIGERSFAPTAPANPTSQYPKAGLTGVLTAYSYCNLHGIWKATATVA